MWSCRHIDFYLLLNRNSWHEAGVSKMGGLFSLTIGSETITGSFGADSLTGSLRKWGLQREENLNFRWHTPKNSRGGLVLVSRRSNSADPRFEGRYLCVHVAWEKKLIRDSSGGYYYFNFGKESYDHHDNSDFGAFKFF